MENKFEEKRNRLINALINEGYLKSPKIIEAFRKVPRHLFVLERDKEHAYTDYPLGINFGQTISAPSMVAIMLELLELNSGDKVLEVGAGSGWNAALVAYIIGKGGFVHTIELEQKLVDFAAANLKRAGIRNVEVRQGNGSKGWKEHAPYDKIIMACACPEVPKSLFEQLKAGGLVIAPVGGSWRQELKLYEKVKSKTGKWDVEEKSYGGCVFVPLRR